MGLDTEVNELSRRRMRELVELDREFQAKYAKARNEGPFNGSTKFVNFMLSFIALLLVSAVSGAFVLSNDVAALKSQVRDLQEKVQLIIEGRIRYPDGRQSG
jgi:hypothetical protein